MKEKTRKCKYCGSETTTKVGIHNWKNLFRKPTIEDYITLFIILMATISFFAYQQDIKNITEYYEGGDYCAYQLQLKNQEIGVNPLPYLNLSQLDSSNESNGG